MYNLVLEKPKFQILGATGKEAGIKGRCTMDTFAVSVPGGASTSVICGTNSGEHCKLL